MVRLFLWIAVVTVCLAVETWDGTFLSRRFSQRYRLAGGIIVAESEVTVNSAASRVWQELQGDWSWWTEVSTPRSDESRWLGASKTFGVSLSLGAFGDDMSVRGNTTGVANGVVLLQVRPHCCIPWRSVVKFSFQGVRNSWLLSDTQLARSLLWAARGDLSWYPHVRGFSGLVRRLEGAIGARHDLVEDTQLDAFAASKPSTLLWASVLDTNAAQDNHPITTAKSEIDLARIWRQVAGQASEEKLYLQFVMSVEDDGDREGGWSTRGRVKVDLVGAESRLSFVLDESDQLSLRLPSLLDETESLVVARPRPAPPGVPRLVSVEFGANWTCRVQVDDEQAFVAVVPGRLRDESQFEHLSAVELRSGGRAVLRHVLFSSDPTFAAEIRYFASRRVAAARDAHSLAADASGSAETQISWMSLLIVVSVLAGGPLLVARLAAFDSGLIPKKGLADKPLLYFRLAPSAFWTHAVVAGCVVACFLSALFRQSSSSSWLPNVVEALTADPSIALVWRIAACVLTVQRITEAYLGFKTYIDKLTEKSFRVAFPLFQFQYWLWMNRVSLVSHVLETLSLLVVSLASPYKRAHFQALAWVLFHTFHLLHVVSHFLTFNELKRSYHTGLVVSLRHVLNAAVASALLTVLLRAAFAVTAFSAFATASRAADWIFFAASFVWHFTVQREFLAPEDTRLYVGRRVALGASVRCSECARPFSRTRTRETCADCRDECCVECGAEVHLAELGAAVDMALFCCSKCHKLLMAEVASARARALVRPSTASAAGPSEATEICRMFQRGDCSYGASCRYLHVRIRSASRHKAVPVQPVASAKAPNLVVSPVASSDVDSLIESDTNSLIDSSSGVDSLSSIEKKKRRRGKRGQRKKKGQLGESDGFDELMMQEAEVNEIDDTEKDHME